LAVEIFIEGQKLDLFDDETISVNSVVQDVKDISKIYADFSQSFTVPASANNNNIFKRYYNADIDDGFDARTRTTANIDIDTLDFKFGKIRLDEVKIENNQPVHYKITFFGDIIKVKDLISDDKLQDLEWLDNFTHEYSNTKVIEGLTQGLDFTVDSVTYNSAVIYPLISYRKQFYYNSDPTDSTDTDVLTNLNYNATFENGIDNIDLKPAIKLEVIIQAIKEKYDLDFVGSFFESPNFKNIYVNLNNSTEAQAKGYKLVEDKDATVASAFGSIRYTSSITPKAGFETVDYKVKMFINDEVVFESAEFQTGNTSGNRGQLTAIDQPAGWAYNAKTEVITNDSFEFDCVTRIELFIDIGPFNTWLTHEFVGYPITYLNQVIDIDSRITTEVPDIEVFEFLVSIFKMFNSTIVPEQGQLKVNDLESWYREGAITDITKYVDTTSETVGRGRIFNEINFKFEETEQILAEQFKSANNEGYGDLVFKLTNSAGASLQDVDGEKLDIEVLFENPIYERLIDVDTSLATTIQYCPYIDKNINAIAGNPFLFYANLVDVSANPIGFKDTTYTELNTSVYMPSHSLQIDSDSFTLNFNSEINEYTYAIGSQTIYKNYYQDYITDIFSIKRRVYNFKAILPSFILNTLRLNDRLIIKDSRYLINSISSDLTDRGDELELINDIYDAPLASDILNNSTFIQSSKEYNGTAFSDTTTYIGVSGSTAALVDIGDGTSWVTLNTTVIDTDIKIINFDLSENETGNERTTTIQVTDGINNPIFQITQKSKTVKFDNNIITFDSDIVTFDQK
jgi:hypothetical protein